MKKEEGKRLNKIHSVKYNFIMNFILTASQFIFPLLTSPYIFRVLTPYGNGKVTFAASVASYFTMLSSLGIPTYGVRACAAIRDDRKQLSKTVREIFTINLIATGISVVLYLVAVFTVPKFSQERTLFLINGISIVLNIFGMDWFFQAIEQYDYITYRSLAFKTISVILMFMLVHTQQDYVIYGAITVFAAVGSNILNFIRINKMIDLKLQESCDLKKHLRSIFILFAQSVAISVYSNLDVIMLGFIKGDSEVGYYNVALKLKNLLLALVLSLGKVLMPRMSYYFKNDMNEQFRNTLIKSLNFTLMLSLAIVSFFVINSRASVLFLGGSEYLNATVTTQIILLAIIPAGLSNVTGIQVLTPMEREKKVLLSVISGAIVNLVLNLFLISRHGASGVAFATSVAEFVVLAVQVYYLKDLLKNIYSDLDAFVYFCGVAISCILSIILKNFVFQSPFIELVINAIVYFGTYTFLLLLAKDKLIMQVISETKNRFAQLNHPKKM